MYTRYSAISLFPSVNCIHLLDIEHKPTVLKVPGKNGGGPERKDVLLEDHDPIWLELRHAHIANVCPGLSILYLFFRFCNLLFRVISTF